MRKMNMKHRVVVTGIGVIVPGALNNDSLWNRVKLGKSGIERIERINIDGLQSQIGGELLSFDPVNFIEQRQARRMDRYAQLSVSSAILACKDAGIELSMLQNVHTGIFEGSSLGPLAGTLDYHRAYVLKECCGVHPHILIKGMMGAGSGFIAMSLGTHGPSITISEGSASSACAIGYAFRQIKYGSLDFALAGGSEAPLSREIISTFCSMHLLSTRNEEPQCAVKPFDRERDGFVLSEGSAFLFLESFEHAVNRGANIYAEISGFGETTDAYHPTSPQPDGNWIAKSMKLALDEAGIKPSEIQYLNAHGTATKLNDITESKAIKTVFTNETNKPFVSSTKPITGHLLGACGAVESVITILSIKNQFIPGTVTLQNPDDECNKISLPVKGISAEIQNSMNNNYSFGGRNASLIFSAFQSF
jgi:3-oxoacyl-[acyl-carrier-protein] synthase II